MAKDTEIEIVVSLGPEVIMSYVPNVLGYSEYNANDLLYLNSLNSVVYYEVSYGNDGLVIAQDPQAGTELEEWSTVTLVVGVEPYEEPYYPDDNWEEPAEEPVEEPSEEPVEIPIEEDTQIIVEP